MKSTLNRELLVIHPGASADSLGDYSVLRFGTKTPAHTFVSVFMTVDEERAVQLKARDSFDDDLATFLLGQATDVVLPPPGHSQLSVQPASFPSPWAFDLVVIAPPLVAKCFEHQSDLLQRATYWVFPAFSGEFSEGDTTEQFWYQLGRKDGWRVHIIQWNRTVKTSPVWD